LFPERKIRVFYRSGTHRVKTKTLRSPDAERWCCWRGGWRQPIRCCLHLICARVHWRHACAAQKKIRSSRYIINLVLFHCA